MFINDVDCHIVQSSSGIGALLSATRWKPPSRLNLRLKLSGCDTRPDRPFVKGLKRFAALSCVVMQWPAEWSVLAYVEPGLPMEHIKSE